MAAYGALVSLMNIIDRLENHPSPPISIHKQQVESLTQNVTFLQEFLDGYISPVVDDHEGDPFERRIAGAVYAAEDVIESQIVLQIHNRSTIRGKMSSFIKLFRARCKCATNDRNAAEDLYHHLQQVIEEMNLIKKEAMEIATAADQPQRKVSSTHAGSSSTVKETVMVGFNEVLLEVLDKLTGGQLSRQIIPVMGMGGIGKTTLARHVFEHPLVKEHFDICAWTTISLTYNVRETLREVLFQASGNSGSDLSEDELGLKLYQYLWGRRYLIIMDDMWSTEVWDKIRSSFPDCNDGSRIIVTTRMSNLTSQLGESYGVGMKFLDEASSWDLFCKTVFGGDCFPLELEDIGKNIVANCKGLPLSIATIGGLLAKSEHTTEYWMRIEQNLNSIVITNNDEFCLKILRLSYTYLPNYLKPCFLYMGVFEEDRRIRVSMLKKLWVSEGFLKPVNGKCLETIAKEYLKELVDRNLILVDELGFRGNVKFCKIHDLLRDLCLKEVEKERFYHIIEKSPSVIDNECRRVVFKNAGRRVIREVSRSLSHARSIICDNQEKNFERPHNFRLLRTFKAYDRDTREYGYGVHFLGDVFQLVNSRHLAVRLNWKSKFPSSINFLWNLYTLIVDHFSLIGSWDMKRCSIDRRLQDHLIAPIEIWKLHQLRHLEFVGTTKLILPDPPSEMVIMENLQTLKGVMNLYLNEEVVQRIPNLKKLHLSYKSEEMEGCLIKSLSELKQMEKANCFSYLECLIKLENLYCGFYYGCDDEYLQRISFPHSLKKLKLSLNNLELVEILQKIGCLPLLHKLVLYGGTFQTGKWDTIEGQFRSLKLLELNWCKGLKNWTMAESSHFPVLQELRLRDLKELEEIPSEVGEIATLKSITLEHCSESAVVSAKKIVEEQHDYYGDQLELHVRAILWHRDERLQRLASPNFEKELIMAAYGALVSLMNIIDQLENHPSSPISIDKQQVESLTENVTFLQEFLDAYISPVVDDHEAELLERRIADAVYAAEDVIESQIVLQIHNRSTIIGRCPVDNRSTIRGKISSFIKLFQARCKCATNDRNASEDFYHDLQQVIEEMNLIKNEAMEIATAADQLQRKVSSTHAASSSTVIKKDTLEIAAAAQLQRKVSSSTHTGSTSTVKEIMMVGFDDVLLEVLDKLTGGQRSRQIIPIMGMGGIGKTTLARHVFEHALVKQHFDICGWTTISQTYNVRETLRKVFSQVSGNSGSDDLSEGELGLKLYQYLWGRRYLIIMDDVWSTEVWDKIRSSFPDCNNGSRIIVTTRLSNLTSQLGESYGVGMKFLDEASSWDLFTNTVFGGESFPPELKKIGKNIVANCKGLPLSIATIGGHLAKSERTTEYWMRIEQNLNSIVITNNDEFCLKILRLSYTYLPNYLKPCFLYMGVFKEDSRIRVSMLKKLWVSEGFLKPVSGKCLETIAKEYLKELVDRNLILVDKLGFSGNAKFCKIHDLLRDLCLKEVEKERFYHIIEKTPSVIDNECRRVVLKNAGRRIIREVSRSLSHARSIICDDEGKNFEMPHNFKLLRTFKAYDRDTLYRNGDDGDHFLGDVFQLVNSRHLAVRIHMKSKFPSSINLLWNLYTLIVALSPLGLHPHDLIAPIEIWKLHQLRHLECMGTGLILPDPPSEMVIMENLQTLKGVMNLYLNEEVVQRIPNLKKLHLFYNFKDMEGCLIKSLSELKQMERDNCFSYLECLSKLENLSCDIYYGYDEYLQRISFPHSLKKLNLIVNNVELEEILQKIACLPLLQKLVLQYGIFKTGKWDTIEGQFRSLKLLQLYYCKGLENWTMAESSHFPVLQELRLRGLRQLEEIPSEVGEIATLKSITLEHCSESAVVSAKKIVEEQEDLYGDQLDLHVRAILWYRDERLQSLASPNFEVTV
ncbi:uncharacterized protein LOC130994501 [Salvia miltiorrhiza]|uniref:uncharacterized protein LOC130994501 n=1 Tax=Salvia miltiorrhiza TaxID=226208 RepID=UPI0025AD926E|nr:uncharacterized protein LOC130994501 [Salvia miltiorrhiza]